MNKIQSFVRRSRCLTLEQKTGLYDLWPVYGIDIGAKKLDLNTLFAKQQPIVLEIGFGNGDSLLQMAIDTPEKNFLGIEVYEAGIGRLISAAYKHQLNNLKIINADAVEVIKNNFKNDSFSVFQLFFPDPWQKNKHHKRRIVQPPFLDLLSAKIINGGSIHLATDWWHYAQQMMEILQKHPHFKNLLGDHIYSSRPKNRPITKFERRGKKLGHGVWDLIFICEK